jgi:hypothetical protein
MHPLYYYFGAPDSNSADDTYARLVNVSISMELSHRIRRMRQPLEEGTCRLRSSPLLNEMRLNSLWTKECNLSKSANCRIGSTRNEKICAYFNKPLSISARHAHTAKVPKREPAMSIVASSRIRQSSPSFRLSQPEHCRSHHAPS